MGIFEYFLAFLIVLLVIGLLCFLLRYNLKVFTVLSLNAIMGFNLTLILSAFKLINLNGFSALVSGSLGTIGSILLVVLTFAFGL